ncbi:Retrotransposable element Tf2 [Ceratobasidium theobromae]|uniref:Retrotransposable element Tf2 n=1 Tax=Ceratobasidium theobromae TaxID=1582974 RepID=A0A5N5Q7K4_9AGAM|nr:Retrotransposable element Tf2 [Ceratobasidium theobromae]
MVQKIPQAKGRESRSSSTRPQPSPIFPTPLLTSQATPGPVPPPTLKGGDQTMRQTQIVRAATQTPGPTQPKSKIPAPEKYDGKKGPAAKSFMLDCKTYFAANPSSFPSDESQIIFVLSTLKEGIAKQWADWDVFEAGFLSNWTDPAALLTAEQKLGQLQQRGSANDYATEFRILQTDLEWDDSAYMAAFRKGLKSEVRAKLIEHSLSRPIRTLDDLITTACLIDDALFMARKEHQQHTANTPSSSNRPAQGKSAGFVTRDIQDKWRKAGECVKCGDSAHKFENCPNGWKTRSGERPRTENGKIGSLIDLEDSTDLIPLLELPIPQQVVGINGKEVKDSIRFKCTLHFNIQNTPFSAIFYCLPLGSRNLILGMPWLSDANPLIDWRTLAITVPGTEQGRLAEPAKALAVPPEFQEFTQVFGEEFFTTLPPHRPYDCEIPLEEGKDVPYGPIYPMTPAESLALKEQLDSELAAGKIRPSTSPAGAPVMFVKRADGRLRLVVDYRRLNNITIKNRYALPRQDELIEKLKHAKIFTKLDLRNGFNNVRIKEGDEWKTAFQTKYGHFEYTVMPFGLTNAPAVFQRLMNDIFRDLLDIYVIVYLDDILIFSNSKEEHLLHIKEVLHRLEANQLFCNPDKCFFLKDRIGYISLTITPQGISMEQEKVKAIREWPTPSTVKQLPSAPFNISDTEKPTLDVGRSPANCLRCDQGGNQQRTHSCTPK